MELLGTPKTAYLLEASLETLHAESIEWLHDIDFWNEEMSFLFKIVRRSEMIVPLPPADIDALDREMIRISGEKLDTLKNDIHRHEQKLREVFSIFSAGDENQYRHTHRDLLQRIHDLQQEMRDFKKRVFTFIR